MTAIIAEQSPITYSNWPLEAHARKEMAVVEPTYSARKAASERGTALECLFQTRRRGTAVVIEERLFDHGPICVGRSDELVGKMSELEGHCEESPIATKVWVALKCCRDFVQWRNEAESRVAGGVAA